MDAKREATAKALEPKRSRARDIVEWVAIIAAAVVFAILLRTYVVEPYEIPSESMINTIQVGDRILGEKITYRTRDPEAGEVVTFLDPEDSSTTLIKRVIATPGQTVDLQNGVVYVDGVAQDEPYVLGKPTDPIERHAETLDGPVSYPYTLGDDEYWVMGDNRTNSLDSRYFGPITRDMITSRAWVTFWPLNDVGVFESGK
ncbi:signal peptidase I [Olsenella sp. YH-ols2217]|uniref:Signal peptidase I n=1 Tax=Kribbibacterium absianum TaxID=3044210 RepID=A0ABT6ZIZ2_9ACTN|nr:MULTISPECIES: signal peptidase I [unclassified Olsenella]MDJ1121533.1 signal peptidase I [Olsenella sp. YH-ols2216]MDJ1129023.1 signal peptidase I [Olsenella sp. YH-ols2217]